MSKENNRCTFKHSYAQDKEGQSSASKPKGFSLLLTAALCGATLITSTTVFSNTAKAQVNCGSFKTHYKRANCYRQMRDAYRNQQRTYEGNARRYNRVHRGAGWALTPVPPLKRAWNTPRHLNQGYNWFRGR